MQAEIISLLMNAGNYQHPVSQIEHIETHISHVFLTGEYAYKLKKAVKFDFLDFSTLEKRKFYCEEELRLNSRFASELYLEVIPISRNGNKIVFGPGEEILDYVIQMRQFDENSLFDQLEARGELRQSLLLQITDVISKFHLNATPQPEFWTSKYVAQTLKNNFEGCLQFCPEPLEATLLNLLRERTEEIFLAQKKLIQKRQKTHVRALHGDLHLKNMCVYQGKAQLFDGIEFNPELSNCDVWADFAFFIMDLLFRDRTEEAALVWNHYLQQTDDFEGFKLLNLYVSYRAAVRCRVSCLALEATESKDRYKKVSDQAIRFLNLALTSLEPCEKKIIVVGGLSGTGKSTLSSILAQRLSAVHICSDAVRKHLCGVSLIKKAPADAYSEEMNKKTYQGLLQRAEQVLDSGRTVVVDAVFHSPIWRSEIEAFAKELKVPFLGIWCEVSPKVMMERVRMRGRGISDANESVVALQETYQLGKITWQHLDTSLNEEQTILKAMSWIV